jgi:flagellar motor switch protein FliM
MASDTLSQNEIDQLFGGADAEESAAAAVAGPEPDVQVYDFRRPARISKDRQRSLEAVYGLLATSVEAWLTARLRTQVQVQVQGVDQISFGEFMLSLPTPCTSYLYEIDGSGGHQAVLDLGSEFASFCVDRLLGGSGPVALRDRALTALEQKVVQIVADRIAGHVADAWGDHVPMEFRPTRFESIPDMIQLGSRDDPVLVGNLQVQTREWDSLILLCLPFPVLEKFFTGPRASQVLAGGRDREQRDEARRQIEEVLWSTSVEVSVRIPTFRAPIATLAGLEPGQVLPTRIPTGEPVEVRLSGQRRFLGQPGRSGMYLGVKITQETDPEVPGSGTATPLERGMTR